MTDADRNNKCAENIRRYWAQRGYHVSLKLDTTYEDGRGFQTIVSDMKNGLPAGEKLTKAV